MTCVYVLQKGFLDINPLNLSYFDITFAQILIFVHGPKNHFSYSKMVASVNCYLN